MIPVSEHDLTEAAKVLSLEIEENNFSAVLDLGKTFKLEGLQPMYFFDEVGGNLLVTSKEHLDKKFH